MKCSRCGSPHTTRERQAAHLGTTLQKRVLKCKMCRHVQQLGLTDPFVFKMEQNLNRMRHGKAALVEQGKNCGPITRAIRVQEDLLSSSKLRKGL